MKLRRHLLKKAIALLLSFMVVLPAFTALIGDSGSAQAVKSLPSIQELKISGGTINILEVLPAVAQGSIGYYIDGQEPCAAWAREAAKKTSQSARSIYISALFTDLSSASLLGIGNTTPLEKTILGNGSLYNELLPWEAHVGYAKMDLDQAEQTTVSGEFTHATNGAFVQSSNEFVFQVSGSYVQIIDYFAAAPVNPKGSDNYFYAPVFAQIENASALPSGTAIYKNTATYDDPNGDPFNGLYVYEGALDAPDFPGMEINKDYYYVTSYGAPSTTQDGINRYVAASSAFSPKAIGETGYFNPKDNVMTYRYVGTGGTYNFSPNTVGNLAKVIYNTVYYQGGFTNNNWFLRYVFDWSPENGETKPSVVFRVKALTASAVTNVDVEAASLVVLSKGFVPNKPGTVTAYSGTNDMTPEVSTRIAAAVAKSSSSDTDCYLPVLVDKRLIGCGASTLSALATTLKAGKDFDSFVADSVFFFATDTVRTDLATATFKTAYPAASYNASGSAFYPAYEEILNENFLRTTENPSAVTLEEKVSMARALRYIINFAGKRIITPKTSVRVLEIQPGSGTQLTAGTIKQWLGYAQNSTSISVTIETMSTAELIGKIDVISEKYDIVYIGSKISGFNPTHPNTTTYNDPKLKDLIYTGVGDTITMQSGGSSGFAMSGLLDRDYSAQTFSGGTYRKLNVDTAQTKTFRYSGNDITQLKMQELQDFVNSGYPLIFADELVSGIRTPVREAATFGVTLTGAQNGTNPTATLTAQIAATSGDLPVGSYTYKWYKNGSQLSTGTSTSTSLTYIVNTVDAGSYSCEVNYTVDAVGYMASSNVLRCTIGAAYTSLSNNTTTATSGSFNVNTPTPFTATITSTQQTSKPTGNYSFTVTRNPSSVLPSNLTLQYDWYRERYDPWGNSRETTKLTTDYSAASTFSRNLALEQPPTYWAFWSYYDFYYCVVTPVNSTSHVAVGSASVSTSNSYRVDRTSAIDINSNGDPAISGSYPTTSALSFSPTLTPVSGTAENTQVLTASPGLSGYSSGYQWYKDGSAVTTGGTNATLSVPNSTWANNESHTYYCRVTLTSATSASAMTNTVMLTRNPTSASFINTGGGQPGTIPAKLAQDYTISSAVIDNSSNIFQLLDGCKSKLNFMSKSLLSTAENQDRLNKYVNLSKPEIVYANTSDIGTDKEPFPTVYSNTSGTITSLTAKSDGSFCLDYYFSIRNSTDTDPANTRYTSNLYLDANGDGLYNTTERLSDVVVRTWDSTTKTAGNIVSAAALRPDTLYFVTRTIPAGKFGILPWKLEIKKAGASGIISHCSDQNYTHIRTAAGRQISLDILQINADNGLSLQDQMQLASSGGYVSAVTNLRYKGIYGRLFADISNDYNVTITTKPINDIEPVNGKIWTHGSQNYTNLLDYLKSYDMIITGFKDSYGNLSQASAQAIASYIGTGKAILFTHDNTSFYNMPFNDYQTTTNLKIASGWGYAFNTTIRDAVGLDRYGVTDPKYGISSFAPQLNPIKAMDWNGLVAKSYAGAGSADLAALTNAGYSIAYEPKTARVTTTGETQGFARGILDRFKGASDSNATTSTVSQVNQGQITTYPYYVNTTGFVSGDNTTNTMSVANTHFQYYQLNMNTADTVVWYCLNYKTGTANNDSVNLFNDAINSYYIYSKGNVTYSGAGHTTTTSDVNSKDMEAKLFVNTMIAAYRIAQVPPVINFTDPSGKIDLENFLIVGDDSGVLSFVNSSDPTRNIHFTVKDPSIGANKMTTVRLSYGDPAAFITVPVFKAETNTALASQESIVSSLTYYIKVDDLWSALPPAIQDTLGSGIKINIMASTSIGVNPPLSATTSLYLRPLTLFALR